MRIIVLVCMFLLINNIAFSELVLGYQKPSQRLVSKPIDKMFFVYEVKYREKQFIRDSLLKVFPEMNIVCYEGSEALGIYSTLKEFEQARKVLQNLDHFRRQVMVEVEVIEISSNSLKELGVRWDDNLSYKKSGLVLGDKNIYAKVKLACSSGKATLKAKPSLVVLDSDKASFYVGENVPYATPVNSNGETRYNVEFIESGMNLEISPSIVSGNIVRTEVSSEMSFIKGWKATSAGEYPMISKKKAVTMVDVKSSQTFVIAGLNDSNVNKYLFKIPFLGDLPFLDNFFSYKVSDRSSNELLFLIKPTIVE